VLTGNSHTHMAGRGVLQEIERKRDADSLAVFEPLTKRIWRPTGVERLPRILQRAFAEMLTGRRGPVVVDLPMDVQCDSAEVVLGDPHTYRPSGPVLPDPDLIAWTAKYYERFYKMALMAEASGTVCWWYPGGFRVGERSDYGLINPDGSVICAEVEAVVRDGATIVMLSDRSTDERHAPIPIALAVGAVHHHLIDVGLRLHASIIAVSGEPRDAHDFACLMGFGAASYEWGLRALALELTKTD